MKPTPDGRAAASEYLRERMRDNGMYDATELARATGLDPDTVRDLLNCDRWPRIGTLGKIEATLGVAVGTLARVANFDLTPPAKDQAAAMDPADEAAADVELLMTLLARAQARLRASDPSRE